MTEKMTEKELNEAVASLMEKKDKEALAELIVEYVAPNHLTNEFVSLLLDTRALKPGDALVKKTRKGIQVRTLVPGSIHLASELTVNERINYALDGADVKVNYSEWDMENGDIGTVADIRTEMTAKLGDFYVNKVFTMLSTVWSETNTADNFIDLGTAITSTALKDAIDRINKTTPGVKVVVGSRAAMTPITTFAGFWTDGSNVVGSQSRIDEILSTGKIGNFYGAQLRTIEQVYDAPDTYKALIPEDKILVIGEKVGEFITYGDVKWKQWSDMNPTPPMWNIETYQQFGMIVDNANGIYVIKVA